MLKTNESNKPYYQRPEVPDYARHDEYIQYLIHENKRRIELLEKQLEELAQLVKVLQ